MLSNLNTCKINILLTNQKSIILDLVLPAKYKTDFWSPNISITKIKYNTKWVSLKVFKEMLYSDKNFTFDYLKINVIL